MQRLISSEQSVGGMMMEHKRCPITFEDRNITTLTPKRHKSDLSLTSKEKKEKVGERIAALQQLVSPYGKTDTAAVLLEAMEYISFLHEQVKVSILTSSPLTTCNWVTLRDIAIGVAKGLDYLHQGCNQRILHFDIKPQNILLDQNFNPKVSDFGLAKLCSKDQSAVSMTAARGTIGFIAPEVFSRNFGNVSYKSDVYSFGMLLVDMVGGRKTIKRKEIGEREEQEQEDYDGTGSQMYFPEWMYKKLEQGEEINIQINNNKELEEEEDEVVNDEESVTIFKKLAMVGLWCIQWCPAARPSMKVAIQMLEGENLPPMPPNPFGVASRSIMQNAFMTSIPEEIHEPDIDIA